LSNHRLPSKICLDCAFARCNSEGDLIAYYILPPAEFGRRIICIEKLHGHFKATIVSRFSKTAKGVANPFPIAGHRSIKQLEEALSKIHYYLKLTSAAGKEEFAHCILVPFTLVSPCGCHATQTLFSQGHLQLKGTRWMLTVRDKSHKAQTVQVKHCFACGGELRRRYREKKE